MSYSVETTIFSTGERFVHLITSGTRLPHFESTVFNMKMLRGRGLATATIEQVLRAIKILLLFCDMQAISLSTRMQEGFLLSADEVDDLVRLCRMPMFNIEAMALVASTGNGHSSPKRLKLFPSSKSEAEVGSDWITNRIIYIRDYLAWLADVQRSRFAPDHAHYLSLTEQRHAIHQKLTAVRPLSKGRNVVNQRISLDEKKQAVLWKVIDPASTQNVWVGRHCRVRNELMVRMFIKLGVRRGELAGISVRDIDFRARTLLIRRRADDKTDPRVVQPNAKTLDRILPLTDDLIRRIHSYVIGERRAQPQALTHPFLFVANGGRPLGLRAINKVFELLVERCEEFDQLFPHLLRHTFNDNLSATMEEDGRHEDDMESIRSELNGWKKGSGTAATYTKRTIQKKAREASLELQGKSPIRPISDE